GVIDNWSGAALLPLFAEFVRERPRRHAFEFVGFAGEEKGLLGSRAYLRSLSQEDRGRIAAVITMDSLGLSATSGRSSTTTTSQCRQRSVPQRNKENPKTTRYVQAREKQ